jgi:RimJ/RimL family protein N-acetyltransferase
MGPETPGQSFKALMTATETDAQGSGVEAEMTEWGTAGRDTILLAVGRPKTRDEAQAWIGWNQRLYRDRGFGLWAMVLRAAGEFAGDCGLTPQRVDRTDEIEVGYHVRASLQGNGYATEAATACRDFARDTLGLHRLIAIINPANIPSQKVAEKIGLRREKHAHVFGCEQVIYAGSI